MKHKPILNIISDANAHCDNVSQTIPRPSSPIFKNIQDAIDFELRKNERIKTREVNRIKEYRAKRDIIDGIA